MIIISHNLLRSKNVLVVGMGPSGIAMSYYMIRQGYNVVGIDGLPIDKLDNQYLTKSIKDIKAQLYKDHKALDCDGFGGVASYGITQRWDKNNLVLLRIMLLRSSKFSMYGNVNFGYSLTYQQAITPWF